MECCRPTKAYMLVNLFSHSIFGFTILTSKSGNLAWCYRVSYSSRKSADKVCGHLHCHTTQTLAPRSPFCDSQYFSCDRLYFGCRVFFRLLGCKDEKESVPEHLSLFFLFSFLFTWDLLKHWSWGALLVGRMHVCGDILACITINRHWGHWFPFEYIYFPFLHGPNNPIVPPRNKLGLRVVMCVWLV
jgi:hypothetical protein